MPMGPDDKYEALCVIGKGTFGRVSKVQRRSDGMILAWKELYYGDMSEKEKQQLVAEVNILRELQHSNIVKYYDRVIDRTTKKIYVVMEFCAGGDLATYIKTMHSQRRWIEERFIWKVLRETASALRHCHRLRSGKILHRDLKPGNIFLDENQNVKLGDFGLARMLKDSVQYAQTHVGTPYYMSPEQVSQSRYNEKSDIWSLGCLTYELSCLTPPFRASNQLALALKIQQGRYRPLNQRYSSELHAIVGSMLSVDPEKRPTIDDILRCTNVVRYRRRDGNTPNKDKEKDISERKRLEFERNDSFNRLRDKRDEIRRRQLVLEEREAKVALREKNVELWERRLAIRESKLDKKEKKFMEKRLEFYKLQTGIRDRRLIRKALIEKENVQSGQIHRKGY
ncbi:hypothetical protein AAMO2058_000595700 [Amorphochlora amoebiformis]